MADNKQEPCYYSKPSADCKKIHFDYQCLKSMTPFILSLVIPFVGFKFKILRISWYKCMKPFRYNLQFLKKNAVNISAVFLLMMIEVLVFQRNFSKI